MATLAELVERKSLEPWLVKLVGRQPPMRQVHVTMRFKKWAQTDLRTIPSTHWGGEVPVVDQVTDIIRQFRSGAALHFSRQFNFLTPIDSGVWELKTGDVRLFGWFPSFDSFIAGIGGDANFIKDSPKVRYAECVDLVVKDRDALDLDNPKFISSTDPRDVIST